MPRVCTCHPAPDMQLKGKYMRMSRISSGPGPGSFRSIDYVKGWGNDVRYGMARVPIFELSQHNAAPILTNMMNLWSALVASILIAIFIYGLLIIIPPKNRTGKDKAKNAAKSSVKNGKDKQAGR
jgi:hypothetical protein